MIQGASHASLQSLSIENTGTSKYATGVFSSSASPVLSDLHISVVGGDSTYGIVNESAPPEVSNVSISSFGVSRSRGFVNNDSSTPRMSDMSITASGGANCVGVINNSSASPLMTHIEIDVSGGTTATTVIWNLGGAMLRISEVKIVASGVYQNHGVINENTSPTFNNIDVYVSGGSFSIFAVGNSGTSVPIFSHSTLTATGTPGHGVWNWGTASSIRIYNSTVSGDNNSIVVSGAARAPDALISSSILIGGTNGNTLCSFTFNGAGDELSANGCDPL